MNPKMNNPPHIKKLINQKFGMLEVIELMPWQYKGNCKKYYVKCKCDCGSTSTIETNYLRSGLKNHCGCIPQDRTNVRKVNDRINRADLQSKGFF